MSAHWRRRRREIAERPAQQTAEASLGTAILALVAGALLTVTAGLAAMVELERFGPSVGSIIVVRPNFSPSERWSVSAAVADPKGTGLARPAEARRCLLSPGVMALRGGSLVIEARQMSRPPVYRVHWAGGPTDSGAGDCGSKADLVLERAELMRLANVAGGFSSGLRLIGP